MLSWVCNSQEGCLRSEEYKRTRHETIENYDIPWTHLNPPVPNSRDTQSIELALIAGARGSGAR